MQKAIKESRSQAEFVEHDGKLEMRSMSAKMLITTLLYQLLAFLLFPRVNQYVYDGCLVCF